MSAQESKQLLKKIAANKSVLCVEDETLAREAMVEVLSRYFGNVMEAENGEVGLSLYKKHAFDVVISDLTMPVMNGLIMAHAIKMLNPKQKIVIVSGHNEEDYLRILSNMGITNVLLKPLDIQKLVDVLLNVV